MHIFMYVGVQHVAFLLFDVMFTLGWL